MKTNRPSKNTIPPKIFLKIIAFIAELIGLFMFIAGCTSSIPSPIESTKPVPAVEITAWAALIRGELELTNGCLQVRSSDYHQDYSLIWPPDFSVSITGDDVTVKSGLVSGIANETVMHIGGDVELGGGTVNTLTSEQEKLNLQNCPGPYWIVGSVVSHTP